MFFLGKKQKSEAPQKKMVKLCKGGYISNKNSRKVRAHLHCEGINPGYNNIHTLCSKSFQCIQVFKDRWKVKVNMPPH